MPFYQFFVHCIEDGACRLSQRDVYGIVGRKVVAEFPYPTEQRRVGVAFGREQFKIGEYLVGAEGINSAGGCQVPESTDYFDVQQLGNKDRFGV